MKVGAVLPVWKESRYLALALEQMCLCSGPRLVVWQDQPLYWLGNGPAPSGHRHDKTAAILDQYSNQVEVLRISHSPDVTDEFGGFRWIQKMAYKKLREEHGVELVFWQDSDWLFDLAELRTAMALWEAHPVNGKLWSVPAQHYWRDFTRTMSQSPVTIAYPADVAEHWLPFKEEDMARIDFPVLYHAAYVLNDAEMFDKVHSWGHAPLFKERKFYEKEWIGGDESIVKPEPASRALPASIRERLAAQGAFL